MSAQDGTSEYIFIVGLPRTGTKLLKNVLENSSTRKVHISPENFFLGRFLRPGVRHRLRDLGDLSQDATVDKVVELFYSGTLWGEYWERLASGDLGVDKESLRQQILSSDRTERGIYEILLGAGVGADAGAPAGQTILGDKTGPHLYRVPTLLEWFPHAKVIHTFRDPRAVMASEHKKQLAKVRREIEKAAEAGECWRGFKARLKQPVVALVSILYITFAWIYAARRHRAYEEKYPKNYYLSRYEDLVSEPHESVEKLCGFLGMEFDPAMLNPRQVDSSFSRQEGLGGFNTSALDRWKSYLKPWMKAPVHLFGRKHLRSFGYLR